jgi:hypothetical protein
MVLSYKSKTRAEKGDSRIPPAPEGCPMIAFENWMKAGAPATTLNLFDMQDIPLTEK